MEMNNNGPVIIIEDDLDDITGVVYRIDLTEKTGRFEQTSLPVPEIA